MSVTFEEYRRYNEFLSMFHPETDRAAAVLGGSYVDGLLYRLLTVLMVDDEKAVKEFLENKGPLATFSAKIDLLFLLGYLPKYHRADLHYIRKIRNYFAHELDNASFDTSPVSDWVSHLSFPRRTKGEAPKHPNRHTYLFSIAELSIRLSNLMKRLERKAVPEVIEIVGYP